MRDYPVFIVKKDSPAFDVCKRMCRTKTKPGQVYPVSTVEFEAWQTDVEIFHLPKEKIDAKTEEKEGCTQEKGR